MRDVALVILPFGVGFCLGAFYEARGRRSLARLTLAAPVVAAGVVCVGTVLAGTVSGRAPANPGNPNSLILQWAAAAYMFAPGVLPAVSMASVAGAWAGQGLRRLFG